jgi:hypothetical protein
MAEIEHRSFSTLISGLEDGALHDELTDEVRRIVAELHNVRMNQGGKPKASLAIKIEFKLDSDVIEVSAETKAVLPKRVRNKTVLYATQDNNLTARNPKQGELTLRDVKTNGEMRTA